MNRFFPIAAIAILPFVACTKEIKPLDPTPETVTGGIVITASFEANDAGTKTNAEIGEGTIKPKWAAGDKIMFVDGPTLDENAVELATQPHSVEVTLTAEQISSDGTSFAVSLPAEWGNAVYAVYPASSFVAVTSGNHIRFSIPQVQDGSFGMANICVAKIADLSESTKIQFNNATAIFNFSKFSYADTGISQISVKARDDHEVFLSGTFQFDDSGNVSKVSGYDTVAVSWPAGATSDNSKTEYDHYLAVAPCKLAHNSAIRFYDENGFIFAGKLLPLQPAPSYRLEIARRSYKNFVGEGKKILGTTGSGAAFEKYLLTIDGSTKKVRIAPNNLRWSSGNDYFVENSNTIQPPIDSVWKSEKTDKFYWTTNSSEAHTQGCSGPFTSLFAAEGGALKGWTVPSRGEWEDLISESRVSAAVCAGVDGILIFPDNFVKPVGDFSISTYKEGAQSYSAQKYSKEIYSILMDAGVVFLPAAGFRDNDGIEITTGKLYVHGASGQSNEFYTIPSTGYYWCRGLSSPDNNLMAFVPGSDGKVMFSFPVNKITYKYTIIPAPSKEVEFTDLTKVAAAIRLIKYED